MSPDRKSRAPGAFVAVVGPSGAGKDTLIRLAAGRLAGDRRFHFARRVVTRSADPASEDHDVLDSATFDRREAEGGFCLSWRAHDLAYGLDRNLVSRIGEGQTVIANISRRSIPAAAERFARLAVVIVTAPKPVLIQRIVGRGREDAEAARQRVERDAPVVLPSAVAQVCTIDNSGDIEAALERFSTFLEGLSP